MDLSTSSPARAHGASREGGSQSRPAARQALRAAARAGLEAATLQADDGGIVVAEDNGYRATSADKGSGGATRAIGAAGQARFESSRLDFEQEEAQQRQSHR